MVKSSRLWIGIGVSGACLGLLFWQIDLRRVLVALRGANWWALPIIIISYMVFMFLRAWRWQIMLGSKVNYWPVFHAQSIGYLLTNILPFRLGDLGRAYLIGQHPHLSGLQALSSVALERILDMLVIVLFFALTLRWVPAIPSMIAQAGLVFAVLSVTLFAIMLLMVSHRSAALMIIERMLGRMKSFGSEAWMRRADSFLEGLQSLQQWRQLMVILGLSLADWVTGVAAYYWGIGAFWPDVTWPAAIFTLCVAAFGISLPSSPSAIGVFHASVWLALSVFSATGEQALGFALVYHAVTFIVVLILGGIGLWRSGQTLGNVSAGTRNLLSRQRSTQRGEGVL